MRGYGFRGVWDKRGSTVIGLRLPLLVRYSASESTRVERVELFFLFLRSLTWLPCHFSAVSLAFEVRTLTIHERQPHMAATAFEIV